MSIRFELLRSGVDPGVRLSESKLSSSLYVKIDGGPSVTCLIVRSAGSIRLDDLEAWRLAKNECEGSRAWLVVDFGEVGWEGKDVNVGDFGNSLPLVGSLDSETAEAVTLPPKVLAWSMVSFTTTLSRLVEVGILGLRGERGPSSAMKGWDKVTDRVEDFGIFLRRFGGSVCCGEGGR